jgi:hypothetical protein
VRNEHFFRPKNVKIATFAICSAPVRCYECSLAARRRVIKEAKLFTGKSYAGKQNFAPFDLCLLCVSVVKCLCALATVYRCGGRSEFSFSMISSTCRFSSLMIFGTRRILTSLSMNSLKGTAGIPIIALLSGTWLVMPEPA